MRKLYLTLAAAAAVVTTAMLAQPANAMTPAAGLRGALEQTAMVDQVRWVCTHVWNGRWHHREHCFWTPGYRYRHHHHY